MIDLSIISSRQNLSIFFMFHHLLPHSYFLQKKLLFGAQIWSFFVMPIFKCSVILALIDSNAIIAVSIFRQLLVLFFFSTFQGVLISLVFSFKYLLMSEPSENRAVPVFLPHYKRITSTINENKKEQRSLGFCILKLGSSPLSL